MAEGRGRGCLKFGCFGCAALVLIPLVLVVALAGINWLMREPAGQVEETFSHPEEPVLVDPGAARRSAEEPARDPVPEGALGAPPRGGEGEIVFDVAYAELQVVPGTPGEPLRVEADYDRSKFRVRESHEERDDGSWTYHLEFGLERSLRGEVPVPA